MIQDKQILKPQILNLDKSKKDLKENESFFLLNFQNWVTLNAGKTGSIGNGNQFPANRPACDITMPAGENYVVGAYKSILTNESYAFVYNSNGVHFISRINNNAECEIVYYGPCLPLSADPKRMITNFRCWMKYDRTCKNRAGKELYFVTGEFEGCIDVEASIATNNFTTPFFDRCSTGCEAVNMCVPDPQGCPVGEIVLLSDAEVSMSNFILNTGFQFRYRYVYYDFRASIWSKTSTAYYQDSLEPFRTVRDFGRKIKLRIPVGNPLVDQIEIAVSENNGNTWRKIAIINKYKNYNNTQQKWYERGLAELTNYSDEDCSFDYYFYNDNIGPTVDPSEINRNYNPHPREAQGLFPIKNSLGYFNYKKGNCPLYSVEMQKFKVSVDNTTINTKKGLKGGGRYGIGFVLTGDCGRYSFVYGNQIIDIPRTQDKNLFDFRGLYYDATGMILPDWVTSLNIVRTPNINGFELQWIVDSFTRVGDNIILTVQSLNDYNSNHYFATNTVYQFLEGDTLEFINNGGIGVIFTTAAYGLLSYKIVNPFSDATLNTLSPMPVNFFNQIVIKDDGRLGDLLPGATIELQRPQKVVDNLPYYEVCANIPVENGRLVYETGKFTTFDTYFVYRLINTFYKLVEHTSPNDLWPSKLTDQGRVHVINQYEDERRYGRNITINSETEFNRFGDLEKTIPAPEQGDLIAIGLYDAKIGVAIGEHDSFLFQVSDDFLRVGSNGIVQAAPVDSIISDPEPKVSGVFGCQYDHIGSIIFGDGFITWVDVNRHAFVKHDFSFAKDAGAGKVQLYFRIRCQELETFNRAATNDLDKYRFCAGYNKNDETVMLTLKKLRDSGINNELEPFKKANDTIVFYPPGNEWMGFASFTPEMYSGYNLFDGEGCSFLTYLNGVPYIHPVISDRYNEFFGVAVDEVVGISINKFAEKIKLPLAVEIQSDAMWFAYSVVTDKPGFLSEVPPARVIKDGRKWNFSFLFNKNSKGGLYNSDPTVISDDCRGYYCAVTLVRDNTDANKYGTIDNAKRIKYSELDFIICKFAMVESSGMTENL